MYPHRYMHMHAHACGKNQKPYAVAHAHPKPRSASMPKNKLGGNKAKRAKASTENNKKELELLCWN